MSSRTPQNPYALKAMPFYNPLRFLLWVVPNRFWRFYCHFAEKPFSRRLDSKSCNHFMQERGAKLPDSSVTANQRALLLKALAETESLGTPIAEIGCFNGATTRAFASQTTRKIFAIDPYANPKNSEAAYAKFCEATNTMPHVKHLRQSSGEAAHTLAGTQLSLVFIDAVHDYLNTWFDFIVWNELLEAVVLWRFTMLTTGAAQTSPAKKSSINGKIFRRGVIAPISSSFAK